MRQPGRADDGQPQQRQKARLDAALRDVGIAIGLGAGLKFFDGLIFLRRALDRFDAFDGFGQHRVHPAELAPDGFGGGPQLAQEALQQDEIRRWQRSAAR